MGAKFKVGNWHRGSPRGTVCATTLYALENHNVSGLGTGAASLASYIHLRSLRQYNDADHVQHEEKTWDGYFLTRLALVFTVPSLRLIAAISLRCK